LRARWNAVRSILGQSDGNPATLPIDPALVLVAVIEEGLAFVFTADQRDEAGYRAAVAAAVARIGGRRDESGGVRGDSGSQDP
jgi:hypothetical protein